MGDAAQLPSGSTQAAAPAVELLHCTDVLLLAGLVDTTWYTGAGQEKGSHTHLACELLDRGTLDPDSVHDSYRHRLDNYRRFLFEARPEVLAVEERVENLTLGYCGRLDRRMLIDGVEWIVDLKPRETRATPIQLAGYAGCFTRPLRRGALCLEGASYQLRPYTDRSDWRLFCAALSVAHWRIRHGLVDRPRRP